MSVNVKERKGPPKIDPEITEAIKEAEAAGFTFLGWFSIKMISTMALAALVNPDGTIVCSILCGEKVTDLVSELESGQKVTTSTFAYLAPQEDRGIFKHSEPEAPNIRILLAKHNAHLKKRRSKPVSRVKSKKDFITYLQKYLDYEWGETLERYWLMKPAKGELKGTTDSVEGGYISKTSKTVRVALEDGLYKWGAVTISDDGSYEVLRQDDYECVVAFDSTLGGKPRQIAITREGKRYLFTQVPMRGEPEIFFRLDGVAFLRDSKGRSKVEAPTSI